MPQVPKQAVNKCRKRGSYRFKYLRHRQTPNEINHNPRLTDISNLDIRLAGVGSFSLFVNLAIFKYKNQTLLIIAGFLPDNGTKLVKCHQITMFKRVIFKITTNIQALNKEPVNYYHNVEPEKLGFPVYSLSIIALLSGGLSYLSIAVLKLFLLIGLFSFSKHLTAFSHWLVSLGKCFDIK